MKTLFQYKNTKYTFLLIVLFYLMPNFVVSQTNDSIQPIKPILISEITFKYESLLESLENIRNNSKRPAFVIDLDTNYQKYISAIDSLSIKVVKDSNRYTLQRINNLIGEWNGYSTRIHNWQTDVSKHAQLLEVNLDSLEYKKSVWVISLEYADKKEAPEEIQNRLKSAIDSTKMVERHVSNINDHMIRLQDKLIYAQNQVSKVIDYLEKEKTNFQGRLFVLDSPPLWDYQSEGSVEDYFAEIKANWADQQRILKIFYSAYSWPFIIHVFSFIVLILVFLYFRKTYSTTAFPGDDHRIKLAITTINHPLVSAFALALMLSIYFYEGGPGVFFSFVTLLAAIPVIILFPKYIRIENKWVLYVVIATFMTNEIQELLIVNPLTNRIFQLIKAFALGFVLYRARRSQLKSEEHVIGNPYWKKAILLLAPLFILLIIASMLANIAGAYQLSELLVNGVLDTTTYALIFFVFGAVFSSVLVILLRSKYVSSIKVFSQKNLKFESRISGLIFLYIAFLWVKIVFGAFHLLNPISDAYEAFLDLFWQIGGVKISVGGIMSFVIILAGTFLLARLVKELINDNVFPIRNSTRGLPNAFSMVIRYMIVVLGVYVALSAAGINLSEFGLMAGALGVGLGFGLQNILHNLVSGLIVSFERPIHVGDTVEVDKLHGTVTEIGVRSSKIRTFEGSEVILPNGDLLSKQVINWTLTDQKRRLEIKIRTSFDANPHEVIELLKKEVSLHPNVNPEPNPLCLFEGYGDSALNFRILFWVQYNVGLSTKSDVALGIYDKLKEKKIEAPIHQQRLIYQDKLPDHGHLM